MLNVGGVVESMGTVVKRSLSLSRCWSKVERVSVLSADLGFAVRRSGYQWRRMAQNGADEMAQIDSLLMTYHKSSDNGS